jgi:hypothetical protein
MNSPHIDPSDRSRTGAGRARLRGVAGLAAVALVVGGRGPRGRDGCTRTRDSSIRTARTEPVWSRGGSRSEALRRVEDAIGRHPRSIDTTGALPTSHQRWNVETGHPVHQPEVRLELGRDRSGAEDD